MTVTSVVKDVCAAVGVAIPQSLFTNITGNRTMQEMLSLANEMALRIAYDTRDWVKLRKVQTLTGDGTTASFPLPADFKRMLLTTNVWRSTSTMHSMRFVPDLDEWLNRRARAIYSPYGEWTIIGTQLYISPTMGSSVTAYYPYLHKNCVTLNSGGLGEVFVNDIVSREVLLDALKEFDGTVMIVSHDRFFLKHLVNRVFEVDHGQLKTYEGDYSYYLEKTGSEGY